MIRTKNFIYSALVIALITHILFSSLFSINIPYKVQDAQPTLIAIGGFLDSKNTVIKTSKGVEDIEVISKSSAFVQPAPLDKLPALKKKSVAQSGTVVSAVTLFKGKKLGVDNADNINKADISGITFETYKPLRLDTR
ncbi:MAG: hypothetical protein HQL25_05040 [Candidatus Omnitrophica bacterium]|nr:hypothetical protein [Candidatus Omnitrophota bacterium]